MSGASKVQAAIDIAEPIENMETCPPEFTDEALALEFANIHQCDLRYVAVWGQWMIWNGIVWQEDRTLQAFDYARSICRSASAKCKTPRLAETLASAKSVSAVLRLSQADRRLAATAEQWDTETWLLNTPEGTIDLYTGETKAQSSTTFNTKSTAVSPLQGCPRWLAFLDQVTGHNAEYVKFLQKMVGYFLTGDTSANALFFLHGSGANGKSVFVETISYVLADYHKTAPMELFTASSFDRHPTDLANLQGARLVTASETEEGRGWAESKIKQLTGGDKITARFMRQDYFEYTPQFKLLIAGNHKPKLKSVDEAIRRRFHLLPFSVTIAPAARDLSLLEKLKDEARGILAWAIEGCLLWRKYGLSPPDVVTNATTTYLEKEDSIANWIDDCCLQIQNGWTATSDLFASWKNWCESNGESASNLRSFTAKIETRGFIAHRTSKARGYAGYNLRYFKNDANDI